MITKTIFSNLVESLSVFFYLKRKLMLVSLLLLCILIGQAQNLVVNSFRMDGSDQTANVEGTMVIDQNGNKCALVKVKSSLLGLSFDVGSLGVVQTIQKAGEMWLYVPEGVKRITISHESYGVLRDYDLGQSLKRATTYVMELAADRNQLPVKPEQSSQYVVFQVIPSNAVIELNGEIIKNESGVAAKLMDFGSYDYCVSAPGYSPERGKVLVNDPQNKHVLSINLKTASEEESLLGSMDVSVTPNLESNPSRFDVVVNGISLTMILVEGGAFLQGESNSSHPVYVPSFYLSETEITQELWETIMGSNPSENKSGLKNPVECVSWNDCQRFIEKLSTILGIQFRLPSDVEWEYAARGGNKSENYRFSGSNNIAEVAWYDKNAYHINIYDYHQKHGLDPSLSVKNRMGIGPRNVKKKKPNELGFYDMTGNVWEWCKDYINQISQEDASKKVRVYALRGGGWDSEVEISSVYFRIFLSPELYGENIGFRLALNKL